MCTLDCHEGELDQKVSLPCNGAVIELPQNKFCKRKWKLDDLSFSYSYLMCVRQPRIDLLMTTETRYYNHDSSRTLHLLMNRG